MSMRGRDGFICLLLFGLIAIATSQPSAPTIPAGSSYWGALIGPHYTGGYPPWNMESMWIFENLYKNISIYHWGASAYMSQACGGWCQFYPGDFDAIRNAGVLSFYTTSFTSDEPNVTNTCQSIADGAQDAYWTSFAKSAAAWGHPFFMRFCWEMNGDWYEWGINYNNGTALINTPSQYIAMWRHIHDIFVAQNATNVMWVWCPNTDGPGMPSLASIYPGDAYVDWTCLDGYNWGTYYSSNAPWQTFFDVFNDSYVQMTTQVAPSKPLLIGETGCTEEPSLGNKAKWISDMFLDLETVFPQIHGLVYYDRAYAPPNWTLETDSESICAFHQGVQNDRYIGSIFANYDTLPTPATLSASPAPIAAPNTFTAPVASYCTYGPSFSSPSTPSSSPGTSSPSSPPSTSSVPSGGAPSTSPSGSGPPSSGSNSLSTLFSSICLTILLLSSFLLMSFL